MPIGNVKWFNNVKGFGFIVSDDYKDDLFAHFSSIQMEGYKTLKAGQAVEFETVKSERGIHAVNIQPIEVEVDSKATEKANDSVTA